MDHILSSIHSSMDIWVVSTFWLLQMAQVFLGDLLSILLGTYLDVGLLDHVDPPFATRLDHSCLPVLCGGGSVLASLSRLLRRGRPGQPSAT